MVMSVEEGTGVPRVPTWISVASHPRVIPSSTLLTALFSAAELEVASSKVTEGKGGQEKQHTLQMSAFFFFFFFAVMLACF